MAEKLKDAEDELLESLFATEAIADDGFSDSVVRRIRHRLWIQRFSLPVAAIVGGLVAFKPAVGLLTMASDLVSRALPVDVLLTSFAWLPEPPQIVSGALLLAVAMLSLRMLED